jgi:drug/metabolite transporter (DMT)-like permease
MIALLGGLGAALGFAGATLLNARATHLMPATHLLAWVLTIGLALTLPLALVDLPESLSAGDFGLLWAAGAGNVAGLLLSYLALRHGRAGVVAPIISTEGALAALVAVAAGEALEPGAGFVLGAIALGIWLAGSSREKAPARPGERHPEAHAVLLALAAAVCFGVSLYATGRVSDDLPLAWALIPARLIGTVFVALPLVVSLKLRLPRQAAPLVVASACCEVAGFASYAVGARDGIAIAAVLASQFGAIAALAAAWLFKERLARIQVVGVAVIAAGVALLSALQA